MASIRQKRGRWQAQVRRHGQSASATFDTKAAAQRWARKIEHEIDEGKAIGRPRVEGTVGSLLRQYETEGRKLRPFRRQKLAVLGMIEAGLGGTPLRALTTDAVLAYAKRRREAGAGPVTVNIELSQLSAILRAAHALLGLQLDDAPVRQARKALAAAGLQGKSQERERRPTQGEIDRLIAYFRANPRQVVPMWDLIPFAIGSAMRREEIMRLRWEDYVPERRLILIRDRKDPRHKQGNDELVPLLPVTGYDPAEIIERQPRGGELIFPYRPETVSTIHARACRALGIADLHFHDYRHEGLSRMFEAGMGVEEVAMISGHKDWKTLARYTHLKPATLVARYSLPAAPATPRTPPDDKAPSGRP